MTHATFAGAIPEHYDRHLAPILFDPYARDLVRRMADFERGHVLEIAAGTGAVTRALARAMLHRDVTITATDLNQPMLDHASLRLGGRNIVWRQADAGALPFEDRAFDAAICQFGAMFFPDKTKAYREARRVMAPGGRFVFSVWDSLAHNEFGEVVHETITALFPDDPPLFIARIPHGYHDVDAIRAALADAGFARIEAEHVEEKSRAPSAVDAAVGFCHGTPLRNEIEARAPERVHAITDEVAHALARRFGEGPIEGKMRAIVVTAA